MRWKKPFILASRSQYLGAGIYWREKESESVFVVSVKRWSLTYVQIRLKPMYLLYTDSEHYKGRLYLTYSIEFCSLKFGQSYECYILAPPSNAHFL
ncbi:hypothetical protein LENED_009848 [Lentinula edodes]|uniref:Uncharacterized protein n=1 Tax=Lentinula edodes TaxID=5353 RepID=A0A1Q3EKV6_LENED|nr:hypothetical protein LENED_009848 [Lentinula edodes]